MSTPTAVQEPLVGFAEAKVQKLPQIACIGTISEVGEGKLAASGNYVVQPIGIRASGPGKSLTQFLLYRPEWLVPGFDPNTITEYENGKSMLFVFQRNIASKERMSALKGLAGSDASYQALGAALLSAPDQSIPGVQAVLREFFMNTNEGVQVGYVLTQRKRKVTNEETGATVYELDTGYEIGSWFYTTPDQIKKIKLKADRAKDGMYLLGFDPDEF